MSLRGDHIQATVFLEYSDGISRKLPDWMNKKSDGFSWNFYSNEMNNNFSDDVHNVYGTMYDCQNSMIGKNEMYIFKLEKVVYQEKESAPQLDTLIKARDRIYHIKCEIEEMANDTEVTDYSTELSGLVVELNYYVNRYPDIDGEIRKGMREKKDNMIIMYINMYTKNSKQLFVGQQVLMYKIWPFPILQWV